MTNFQEQARQLPLPAQATAFNAAVANAVNGTPAATLDKNNQRTALIAALDQLASYVDLTANNDAAKIVSSGFNLNTAQRNPAMPEASAIVSVSNPASGKLDVALQVAANAWAYIVEYTALPNGAKQTATFTNPHDAVLAGLTPGINYSLRVQVMGSGNQQTDWCDPVQHMAT